jgi:predicted phosphohydrolase
VTAEVRPADTATTTANVRAARVWAIADTHLSLGKPKAMDRFGAAWVNHTERLTAAWHEHVAADDVVLVAGDISWAQSAQRVQADLTWLAELPGHKVLLRGNHDHWWRNIEQVRKLVGPLGMSALEGDSVAVGSVVVCGAMGYIAPEDPYWETDTRKDRFQRELDRLESALRHAQRYKAPDQPLIAMMHYPPFSSEGKPTAFAELLSRYRPDCCIYGHLHRQYEWQVARNGLYDGVSYHLVAADYLNMVPLQLLSQLSQAAVNPLTRVQKDGAPWG